MGVFQQVVQQYADAFPHVGSRYGSGHRPARHYINASKVAQVDSVTFTHDNATQYTVIVDGIAHIVLAGTGADATEDAEAMIALINAHQTTSQIVFAFLFAAGVMHLRARVPGRAFTATTAVSGGAGTATRAGVTANSLGEPVNAGDPMFRPSGGTNARTCRLPAASTDIFLGLVQFRQRSAELETLPDANAYPSGSQVPVDPNGEHVARPEQNVHPGDPVRVNVATNRLRSSDISSTAQVSQVQATAATNTKLYSFIIHNLATDGYHVIEYLSDGSATVTEIRDGLGDRINFLAIPFTAADVAADAISITADVAGNPFEILEVDSELAVTTPTPNVTGTILIANASWTTETAANEKGCLTYEVP